jgi:hypothetical protein
MLLLRSLFFISKAVVFIGGGLWGLAGAAYISEHVLGLNAVGGSLLPMIAMAVAGTFMGCGASVFLFVLPMHFICPKARKKFSWENPEPLFVYRFYQWYGKNLQEFGEDREAGKP